MVHGRPPVILRVAARRQLAPHTPGVVGTVGAGVVVVVVVDRVVVVVDFVVVVVVVVVGGEGQPANSVVAFTLVPMQRF